jgi:LmbE family N-acetylglucosaminyl deacetylase
VLSVTPVTTSTVVPFPEDWQRCLAVVAHPDDLEYSATCAVARWTDQGKGVAYLLVSRGEAGIAGMSPDEAGPLREAEQRVAAGLVGVSEVRFLDHRDGKLEYSLDLRRDIVREIRRYRPEVLVSVTFDYRMSNRRPNQADHRAVGVAALDAAVEAGNQWVFPELAAEGLEPWDGVRFVCFTGASNPTHGVEVTGTPLARGIAALAAHEQYLGGLGSSAPDPRSWLESVTAADGRALGVSHAVNFDVYSL